MAPYIEYVRRASETEWDDIWRRCETATYFHSREWAEIWRTYSRGGLRPAPRLVLFSDERQALLPLSYTHVAGLLKDYLSGPCGTFGGWISVDPLTEAHARLLARYYRHSLGNYAWRLNPYDESLREAHVQPTRLEETHALNLSAGFDAVYRGWSSSHRTAASKAQRAGVTVRPAESLEDWRAYFEVYEDSLRRWGEHASSRYGWELFADLHRRRSPWQRLWLAWHAGQVAAGALCFYARRHAVYWHGATRESCFAVRPMNRVMYEAIRHACEGGYTWFDFNPSGLNEGVRAFKERFGARPLAAPMVLGDTALALRVRQVRRSLSPGCWVPHLRRRLD